MITKLITKGKIAFPDADRHKIYMSADMIDFITGLLQKDPKSRLGFNNSSEVLTHPWLATVKWDSLKTKKIKPPFFPKCE
jgi:serine/threonine protein kinase